MTIISLAPVLNMLSEFFFCFVPSSEIAATHSRGLHSLGARNHKVSYNTRAQRKTDEVSLINAKVVQQIC